MSILRRTNQFWKIYVFLVLMGVGAGVTLFQTFLYRFLEKGTITALVIGGMFLVIGTFAWTNASITCPNCKLRLLWYSITKEGLGTWFTWLANLEKCPRCGSKDGAPVPVNRREEKGQKSRPGKRTTLQ